jgi:RNA polymerase sigma-70 factor (ECF subfamily)
MSSEVTDAELVLAAGRGDAAAAGALLERHRASMAAVALAVLGWRPDADDVVQDAMLVGLTRLADLRDDRSVGPWLKGITRNLSMTRLRRERLVISVPQVPEPDTGVPGPEAVLERSVQRDWLWSALDQLSTPLRQVTLLRYFTDVTSYSAIASLCGVPVGTVRSRLSEARRLLLAKLEDTTQSAHPDIDSRTIRRTAEAAQLMAAGPEGRFASALKEAAVPDLLLVDPKGRQARGQEALVGIMESDVAAGVRQRVRNVVASSDVTVLECELASPAWDPAHCPPGVVWLLSMRDDRIARVRLFHPPALAGP